MATNVAIIRFPGTNCEFDAAEAIARPHGRMTCEVNVRPANEPSLGFHRSRGYAELGELDADETGEKRVVLLAKELPAACRPGVRRPTHARRAQSATIACSCRTASWQAG